MADQHHILFILQPHFSLLAFTAAADALTTANLVSSKPRYQFTSLALNDRQVISDLGIVITADALLSKQQLSHAHVVLVCGGYRCDLSEHTGLSKLLTTAAAQGVSLGGLWNGVIPLAHAGVLGGYECALHPDNHDAARRQFPDLQIANRPVVVDRQRLSAAGANSSLDLMLSVIQRHHGAETVQAVRRILQADRGLQNNTDDAIARDAERQLPSTVQTALQLMRNNLDEPLSRDELARYLNLSTRGIERLFQKHLNTSPARFYLELRLIRARQLLTQSNDSVADIGIACGFVSAAHFSRCFSERFACTPRDLRR